MRRGRDSGMRGAGHAPHGVTDIGGVSEAATEHETELGSPQAILNNPMFQSLRVFSDTLLQTRNFVFWIMQWDTYFDLTEVHDTAEAVRRLLIIVVLPYASVPLIEDRLDLTQVSIQEVDVSGRRLNPRAPVTHVPIRTGPCNRYRAIRREAFSH